MKYMVFQQYIGEPIEINLTQEEVEQFNKIPSYDGDAREEFLDSLGIDLCTDLTCIKCDILEVDDYSWRKE